MKGVEIFLWLIVVGIWLLLLVDGRRTDRALFLADSPVRISWANRLARVILGLLVGLVPFTEVSIGLGLVVLVACLGFALSNPVWLVRAASRLAPSAESFRTRTILEFADVERRVQSGAISADLAAERLSTAVDRLVALPPSVETAMVRASIARGMADQGRILEGIGRQGEATAIYREMEARFSSDASAAVESIVAESRRRIEQSHEP
jgi:hypothetical protein